MLVVGRRPASLFPLIHAARIATNRHDVALTCVIRRQLFQVTDLEFNRRRVSVA